MSTATFPLTDIEAHIDTIEECLINPGDIATIEGAEAFAHAVDFPSKQIRSQIEAGRHENVQRAHDVLERTAGTLDFVFLEVPDADIGEIVQHMHDRVAVVSGVLTRLTRPCR